MSKTIKHRENILTERERQLQAEFGKHLERCKYEDCHAFNGPNALNCHRCGRRLYGPLESRKGGEIN